MAAPERATWYADVIMMSPGGSGLLTLAVGPADVNIDRATRRPLTGQRVGGVYGSDGPTGQSHIVADRRVHTSGLNTKKKRRNATVH